MTGISETLQHPSIGTGALVAVLGYAVVFLGICMLLIVVTVMGKVMVNSQKKAAAKAAAVPAAPVPAPEPVPAPTAKGTAGELKLYDTDPRDAALIMAIVAHKLGKPINELRFRSIKEVKEK